MFNSKVYAGLNEGEKALVSWQYMSTGCFSDKLMDLIAKADGGNKERLALAYPEHVKAYICYSRINGWWPKLQEQLIRPPLYEVPKD